MSKKNSPLSNDHPLVSKISELIENSRRQVSAAVNMAMVYTYFEIGRMIWQKPSAKSRAASKKALPIRQKLSIESDTLLRRG